MSKPNPHQFWQVSWASPCLHPSLTHAYRSTNDCLRKGDRHTDLSKLAPTRRFAFAGARLRGWGFLDGLVKTMFWDKAGGQHTVGIKGYGMVVAAGLNQCRQCNPFDWNLKLILMLRPPGHPSACAMQFRQTWEDQCRHQDQSGIHQRNENAKRMRITVDDTGRVAMGLPFFAIGHKTNLWSRSYWSDREVLLCVKNRSNMQLRQE